MLVTLLTVGELAYVVVLAIWILFEKRSSVATLAWILVLVALPWVGLIVFFFFGPRRMKRRRLKHARARAAVEAAVKLMQDGTSEHALPEGSRALMKMVTAAGEPPPSRADEVTVFHDAASTYDAIVEAIGAAEHHVHVEYYIFEPGVVGRRIADALIERAKAGVTVRLLVDSIGSASLTRAFVRDLRDAGVKFAWFNPMRFARLRRRIDFRNHRKIVVVDGRVGFTGGINIADDYVERADALTKQPRRNRRNGDGPWRDTHVRIVGDAVRWLQLNFFDDWHFATDYVARDPEYFPPPKGEGTLPVQVVSSGPDRRWEPIQKLYFSCLAIARERVWITTPYFVPDEAVLTALVAAAMRGVDVRILLPRFSDSLVVTAAARSYYDTVLAAGVRVFEYTPTMIHAKTMVVDDELAIIGTANLDNRSFRLNFEVSVVLYSPDEARALAAQFREDAKLSKEIRAHSRDKLPLRWRAAEAGARVLSPLL